MRNRSQVPNTEKWWGVLVCKLFLILFFLFLTFGVGQMAMIAISVFRFFSSPLLCSFFAFPGCDLVGTILSSRVLHSVHKAFFLLGFQKNIYNFLKILSFGNHYSFLIICSSLILKYKDLKIGIIFPLYYCNTTNY